MASIDVAVTIRCPEPGCQSEKQQKMGFTWRTRDGKRTRIQRYRCTDCGRIYIEEADKA